MRSSEPEMSSRSGEALPRFQGTDLTKQFRYKSGISGKQPLRCERVNDITFKITDGKMSRVPALKGWWGGYDTPRALAWVINVGINSAAWLARCNDEVSGPLSFTEARETAHVFPLGRASTSLRRRSYWLSGPIRSSPRHRPPVSDRIPFAQSTWRRRCHLLRVTRSRPPR